jgi:hypothetical protein
MARYKLTLEIDDWADMFGDASTLEHNLMDLLKTSALPALNLIAVTSEVTKKRG